jgi:hypothetical protein
MSKLRLVVVFAAFALVAPLAVSGQKAKPPKPPAYTPCTFELEVNSVGSLVEVGRDVGTYGPADQALYIHESLLPPDGAADPTSGISLVKAAGHSGGFYGPYYGQVRVLDNRIDYWFDTAPGCYQDIAPLCPFRVIVVDGTAVYARVGKTKVLTRIAFDEGRYLLDYRPCDPAAGGSCYFKLYGCYDDRDCPGGEGYVYATVNVVFQP